MHIERRQWITVNGDLVDDGEIDVARPEALIYESQGDKRRLVGVEYIVDAAARLKNYNNNPPVLEGQNFWRLEPI